MNSVTLQSVSWVACFLAIVGLMASLMFWERRRRWKIVSEWAAGNGFRLLNAEARYLRRGPYFWSTARGQCVFHVTLEAADGESRTAWLRVGHWLIGTLSRQVSVKRAK